MNRLAGTFGDELHVLALDANGSGRAAFRAGEFMGHPSYVLLQPDGDEVWRAFGIVEYEAMLNAVRRALE